MQTSGNDLLLRKIQKRRRGVKSPRVVARKYRTPLRMLIAAVALSLAVYFSYKYIYMNPKFSVKNVLVIGGGKFVNEEDFTNISRQKFVGRSIFSINIQESAANLKNNFLGARNVEISKDYPDSIVVKIEERIPVALIRSSEGKFYYLIDKEGYVLGEVSDEFMDLPKIIYDGDIRVGSFINDKIVPVSIEILSEAGKAGLDVSSVSFKERYSKLYLGPTEVYISNMKDIKQSVSALGKLYKNLLLQGKLVTKIDLRYDKVIVSYE
ncbi:MAG: hypothetical protein KatS3mg101_0744 [Patescibacteria group bacterium]|nr:MAG: hypothetical protein KatS3mg101_0744 [Patescibacteria group bacterium]